MPKGQKPYRATKPSTITQGKWLDRSNDDLTPRSNLPSRQYEGVGKMPLNPQLEAAVKRGAIRKD